MSTAPKHYSKRSGSSTWWRSRRASPRCSTSTCNWCTRSLPRRRLKGCAWPAARCAVPTAPSPRSTTTCRPPLKAACNIVDQIAAKQIATLRKNCADFGVELYDVNSREQGIVHVIGPELGITKPGMTIVCGDSHTSTHGAFGALAFGIGTSEVEHVLATQTLPQSTAEDLPHLRRRQAAAGRHREGHHPRHHRQDRHRRRDGLRD